MGLEWVVRATRKDGVSRLPTDVLGARRADRSDPEVLAEMRRFWQQEAFREFPFDTFVDRAMAKEPPPIVIRYGAEQRAAIPYAPAMVQYYGYRAKALEPHYNGVTARAGERGFGFEWLYDDLLFERQIRAAIGRLRELVAMEEVEAPELVGAARSFWSDVWLTTVNCATGEVATSLRCEREEDLVRMSDILCVIGAASWLEFWLGKGFPIVADY